ncbi:MAG: hypothetical protein ACLQPD_06795 [Desulfomonilaceae bacterium]
MVAWMIFFGPIGLMVTLFMIYAVHTANAGLSIICGAFLSAPPVLTTIWGSVAIATSPSDSQDGKFLAV